MRAPRGAGGTLTFSSSPRRQPVLEHRRSSRAVNRAPAPNSNRGVGHEAEPAVQRALRDGDRRQPEQHALQRRRDGARVGDVVAEVVAEVGARDDRVVAAAAEPERREPHAVDGRAVHREAAAAPSRSCSVTVIARRRVIERATALWFWPGRSRPSRRAGERLRAPRSGRAIRCRRRWSGAPARPEACRIGPRTGSATVPRCRDTSGRPRGERGAHLRGDRVDGGGRRRPAVAGVSPVVVFVAAGVAVAGLAWVLGVATEEAGEAAGRGSRPC